MFVPPWFGGFLGMFVPTFAEGDAIPEPVPAAEATPAPQAPAIREGVPTIDDALADIRRDMRNSATPCSRGRRRRRRRSSSSTGPSSTSSSPTPRRSDRKAQHEHRPSA